MANPYDHQQQMKQEPDGYQMPHPPNSGSTGDGQHYGSSAPASVAGQASVTSYNTAPSSITHHQQDPERKDYLDNQEETLFMQVFVEEVGLWMDSMDSQKHFSRLLPFHSLTEPMLLNAFLACGAKHLTLVNPAYTEEKALHYYDTAPASSAAGGRTGWPCGLVAVDGDVVAGPQGMGPGVCLVSEAKADAPYSAQEAHVSLRSRRPYSYHTAAAV